MDKWRAQVNVKWNSNVPDWKSWDWIKNDWSEVKWAGSTMGDWDLTLWVDVKTPADLENFVHSKVRSKKWVEDTQTSWTKEVWSDL